MQSKSLKPTTAPAEKPWWRHQMETFSVLLGLCVGNSPVTGEFPSQWPVMWSFDVSFDLHLNQHVSKQWKRQWFEMPSRSLLHHRNAVVNSSNITQSIMITAVEHRSTLNLQKISHISPSWVNRRVCTYWEYLGENDHMIITRLNYINKIQTSPISGRKTTRLHYSSENEAILETESNVLVWISQCGQPKLHGITPR